ncbi:MAG: DUF1778 domain-containing protein [Armatimonadetes bacterium]|nr:DUF1778 domain-containing protein [Armatimonadota bacterium]
MGTEQRTAKTERLAPRATRAEKEALQRAASARGESLSTFVLGCALRDADRVLGDRRDGPSTAGTPEVHEHRP